MQNITENLTFIVLAVVFGFLFFGPHMKKKEEKKDDKKVKK